MSTDHGFQLVAAMDPGLSMDPPGGETLELHPRDWIGQGGGKGEGFLRFKASDLELGGSMEFAFPRGLGAFKVNGGVGAYFHGGISPQEHVLPLLRMKFPKTGAGAKADVRVKLSMSKSKITNRIFTLTIETEGVGLFPGTERRVRLEMIAGKTVVGQAVAAGYGFEESTREKEGRLNQATSDQHTHVQRFFGAVNLTGVKIDLLDRVVNLPVGRGGWMLFAYYHTHRPPPPFSPPAFVATTNPFGSGPERWGSGAILRLSNFLGLKMEMGFAGNGRG